MLLRVALRNVLRSPRRTLAILATMVFGVFFLGTFHAFNAGLLDGVKSNTIHARYGHGQIDTAGYREKIYERPWEHWIEDYPKLHDALVASGAVKQVFPRVTFGAIVTNGANTTTISAVGQGVDGAAESDFFSLLHVEQGAPLGSEEKGALVGIGLARSLGLHVGDRLTVLTNTIEGSLNGVDLTVTGIFHNGSPELDDALFRMQLGEAQTLLETTKVETVAVGLAEERDWPRVEAVVAHDFPALEAAPFNVVDHVNYQQFVDWLKSQFGVIELIILMIVLFGIMNNVSTGVLERKQEIGCLKANGDTAANVLGMVALEALVLGVIGALVGALLVFVLVYALRAGFDMPPTPGLTRPSHMVLSIDPRKLAETCVAPIFVAVAAALLAGLRVARMPIAEALRSA